MSQIAYKGFTYKSSDEWEDDNVKRSHEAVTPDGKTISIDFSPYRRNVTQSDFELWIDCGMPDRRAFNSTGPVDIEHLLKLRASLVA